MAIDLTIIAQPTSLMLNFMEFPLDFIDSFSYFLMMLDYYDDDDDCLYMIIY